MKLSVKSFALACAILWGGGFLVAAIANFVYPSYAKSFLDLCSSIYPGYHPIGTISSVFVGTLYALLDGAAGGMAFAWLYNRLGASL